MTPYFILLVIILILSTFAQINKRSKTIYNFYFFLIFLTLASFAGLRNYTVGTDTSTYVNKFNGTETLENYYSDENPSKIEIGYILVQSFSKLISKNYFSLLFLSVIVALIFQVKIIYKLSPLPLISFFVFITFGIYTFSFNGIRQAIAAAIYLYSTQFLLKKNFKKYAFWVFIGFLFHKTIIVTLPLYFILKKKFSIQLFFTLIISSLIVTLFFQQILQIGVLVSEKYKVYIEAEQIGGKLLTLFYLILSLFFIFFRNFILNKYLIKYDVYLNMFLIATMIYLIIYLSSAYIELTRIAFYFSISTIFLWPLIFKSTNKKRYPLLFTFFISIHLLFFYIFLSKMAGLIPYRLNTELFSNII